MRPPPLVLLTLVLACGGGEAANASAPPVPAGAPAAPGPGAPSAAARIERLDPDPECDGLVPPGAPAPLLVSRPAGDGGPCGGGVSDPTGAVAVAVSAPGAGGARWQAFSPDGTPAEAFDAWPPLAAASRGWHAIATSGTDVNGFPAVVTHVSVTSSGTVAARAQVSRPATSYVGARWSLAPDPLGGCVVAISATTLAGNHWFTLDLHRLDAAGAARGPPAQLTYGETAPAVLAAGVSRRGDDLVLWQVRGALAGAWLAPDGARGPSVSEPAGAVPLAAGAASLAPLLDGALALRVGPRWARRYAPGSTTGSPPPDWLAARDGWGLRATRGDRGYALLPPAGAASANCEQEVELRAASGRLCGRVVLGGGGPCRTGAIDQGPDGTVVQQVAEDACTWRIWPRLLAP